MSSDIDEGLPVRVICATRLSESEFLEKSLTALSIKSNLLISPVEVTVYANNKSSLGKLYNQAIDAAVNNPTILVFMHDDILLCDFHWAQRIRDGLHNFDIVGLAGTTRRLPKQPSWAFTNLEFKWDDSEFLSGAVGHGQTYPAPTFTAFGDTGKNCKLLDGLFLATKSETLIRSKVRFDPNLRFHFYDMDFCRSAEVKNLTMGTIALSAVHQSGGNIADNQWLESYQYYLRKWQEI